MEIFFDQLLGSTFIFVKKTHQKAANLMFGLILPVAQVPWWFLGGQYKRVVWTPFAFGCSGHFSNVPQV